MRFSFFAKEACGWNIDFGQGDEFKTLRMCILSVAEK